MLLYAGYLAKQRKMQGTEITKQQEMQQEQAILIQSIIKMNINKLIQRDMGLFEELIQDLFPNEEIK